MKQTTVLICFFSALLVLILLVIGVGAFFFVRYQDTIEDTAIRTNKSLNTAATSYEEPLLFTGVGTPSTTNIDTAALNDAFVAHFSNRPVISKKTRQHDHSEKSNFKYKVKVLLHKMQFQELETLYHTIMTTDQRFGGGYWKVDTFFDALWEESKRYESYQKDSYSWGLDKWQQQFPESILPKLALADYHLNKGWEVRGGAFSRKVPQNDMQTFHQELEKGWEILLKADALNPKDPQLYRLMIVTGKGLGVPKQQLKEAFDKGIAIDPLYNPLYYEMMDVVHLRWYGSDQEWDAFFNWTYHHTQQQKGAQLYSSLITHGVNRHFNSLDTFFTHHTTLPWPLIKQGALDKDKTYPMDARYLNHLCWLACAAQDKEATQVLFKALGDNIHTRFWNGQNNIAHCKQLASSP